MDKKELAMALKDMSDEEILALIRGAREDIVHCCDCKYRPIGVRYIHAPEDKDGNPMDICPWLCEDCFYSEIPPDNFYCAYGERKDD